MKKREEIVGEFLLIGEVKLNVSRFPITSPTDSEIVVIRGVTTDITPLRD